MSRELGWKQFQSDDPPSATSASTSPAPSYLGRGVQAPIPWTEGPLLSATSPAEQPEAAPTTSAAPSDRAGASRPARTLRLGELIWLCLAVMDGFLALDFLLRAVAANSAGVVAVVIGVGNSLAGPFSGVLDRPGVPRLDHTTFWAALVAIVIYTIAAWIAIRLLRLLAAPAQQQVPRS